jgi:small-conductance mechanosensitive channel
MTMTNQDVIILAILLTIHLLLIILLYMLIGPGKTRHVSANSNLSKEGIGETVKKLLEPLYPLANNSSDLTKNLKLLSTRFDILSTRLDNQNAYIVAKDKQIGELDSKIKNQEVEIRKRDTAIESYETKLKNLEKDKNEFIDNLRSSHQAELRQKKDEYEELQKKAEENFGKESQKNIAAIDKNKEIHLPSFLTNSLQEDINKLYECVISGHPEATSLWTSLGSFKSSCREGASPEFTLQILKQLGLDVVKFYASSENSNPEFTHQKLSKWADCLNANSNDRFSLFIPALGAPINNALMQSSSSSAYSVTEVLGWGIRNPNGIVYSTALFR